MSELTIGLGQLRSNTCGYVDRVVAGATIGIVRRGRPVALIMSVPSSADVVLPNVGCRVGLDELRTRAGRCFDRVAAGEMVEIVHRERLVARIVSTVGAAKDASSASQEVLADMMRRRSTAVQRSGSRT